MWKIIISCVAIVAFIIFYVVFKKEQENLDNIKPIQSTLREDNSDILTSSANLPITPNFSSNQPMGNYSQGLFVEPTRYEELDGDRLDEKENRYAGVQPEGQYFDILDISCAQPYKRPWACLLAKGNIVNNIPRRYCKPICPERFADEKPQEEIEFKEDFKNFTENPDPSHFYCYSFCKKDCTKHKYDPLNPEKNTCGQNGFSQVPLPVYTSHAQCIADSFPCDSLGREQCLGNPQCGWCTNGVGEGHCFRSTPEGPFNLKLPCQPSRQKPTNAFKPGRLNPFEGVAQFQPVPKAPFQEKK